MMRTYAKSGLLHHAGGAKLEDAATVEGQTLEKGLQFQVVMDEHLNQRLNPKRSLPKSFRQRLKRNREGRP
jgi:hypothetical protein